MSTDVDWADAVRPKGDVMTLVELNVSTGREHRGSALDHVQLHTLPVGHAWRVNGLDPDRVTALAANYGSLPPIVVSRADKAVVDGAHRVAAARRLGMHSIAVEWFEGNRAEAFGEFNTRNTRAGLPLTAGDREHGVIGVLDTQPGWSDRRVGQLCGVSPKMVARVRQRGSASTSVAGSDKRVGRDGRARPVHAGAMRQLVAEAIESQPEASLRTIAGQLGVSPETVRRVRNSHETQPHRRLTTAICEPMTADSIDGVLLPRQQRPVVAAWRQDNAFDATTGGVSFAEWFDSTSVDVAAGTLADVPLSRVYEIADEARRRASFWSDFAANLESRIRYRH